MMVLIWGIKLGLSRANFPRVVMAAALISAFSRQTLLLMSLINLVGWAIFEASLAKRFITYFIIQKSPKFYLEVKNLVLAILDKVTKSEEGNFLGFGDLLNDGFQARDTGTLKFELAFVS